MTGRIIPGRFGGRRFCADVAAFDELLDHLQRTTRLDERGRHVAIGGTEKLVREVARAAMQTRDDRAKCVDCAQPATRDDGFCNRCRRQRQEARP